MIENEHAKYMLFLYNRLRMQCIGIVLARMALGILLTLSVKDDENCLS